MDWPHWMDHIKAKSDDMGGQTLAQHTWDVLARMADQRKLRPHLEESLSPRIWSQAFWGALLHDFGKAALGFQDVLRGDKGVWSERRHRHEVLSLAFVDWVFPSDHIDRTSVIAMIACHHKDADEILRKYGGQSKLGDIRDEAERRSIKAMLQELSDNITETTRADLWRWLDECAQKWADALDIPLIDPPRLLPRDDALKTDLAKAMYKALREFHDLCQGAPASQLRYALLVRGLIFTADHSASAGIDRFPPLILTRAMAEKPLAGRNMRDHQRATFHTQPGSAILVAPTGSGKTEAALLWAVRQHEQRPTARLFYTLPYQASMNAMVMRLAREFLSHSEDEIKAWRVDTITVRHSRALLKLYQDMMSLEETDARSAAKQAKWLRNKANLNTYPIQVFSPYQMLKVAYSLKGFEALLLDYTEGLFIFDEIHAYDPQRLALIIELMRWLRVNFGARFLVMTATLPPVLQEKLTDALDPQIIHATSEEFIRSQRHTVEIVMGRLRDSITDRVRAEWNAGKATLVCLNQVATAQQVYVQLRDSLKLSPDEEIVLLHGRFNGRDRARKERILLEQAGVGRRDRRPFVCVATQVVEVSLNVDFDTLYTDPAPLEALLQRFGRVNRGREAHSPLLPVHVFDQPSAESQKPHLPYDGTLVENSLRVLKMYCSGRAIDEAQVTTMLGEIYNGPALEAWQQTYENSRATFVRDVLGGMKAFTSADERLQREFYKLFDGIEVLPESLADDYYAALDQGGYLEASQYFVHVPYSIYAEFEKYGKIIPARKLEGELADHIRVDYDPQFGLDIDGARRAQRESRGDEPAGDEAE